RSWGPDPVPEWVTWVPSPTAPDVVADVSGRLAAAVVIVAHAVLRCTRPGRPHRQMANSSQLSAHVLGAREVRVTPSLGLDRLRFGARAMRAAHVTVDLDVIERSFSQLEARFESRVTDAVDEIARTSAGFLDSEDGALTGTLTSFRSEFEQLLGDTFDADSKVSVLAKVEELVLTTMKGLITPEIADS